MVDRINISLDDTAQQLWEKLEDDINNVYDKGGRSEFFRDMLMNYADDKTKLEAKKEVYEDRINALEARLEQLKLEKEGLEKRIDKLSVEEKDEEKIRDIDDKEFWDNTVNMIFSRRDRNDPKTLKGRYKKFIDGRHTRYTKNFDSIPENQFKKKLFEEAKQRGFDDKIEKLK